MLWLFQVKKNQRNVNCWVLFSDDNNVADEATRASSKVDISPTSRWIANKIEIKIKNCLIMLKSLFIDFYLFSWFPHLIRSFAWTCRFINRCRKMFEESEKNGLTFHELKVAEKFIIIEVQNNGFIDDMDCMKKLKPLPRWNCLKHLSPYIDD